MPGTTVQITYEQDERGRWRIYADGQAVHTIGRRVGQFSTLDDAQRYATRRFGAQTAEQAGGQEPA